ncbi:hypothetical protein CsatA_013027 [Cannabis sativa]
MSKPKDLAISTLMFFSVLILQSSALVPYRTMRPLWEAMTNIVPDDDPFRILDQTPFTKEAESRALARADWKETATEHVISVNIPGVKKEDVKIEVEENRVVRISGELKAEEEREGDRWHRSERISGKFWRQFRLPVNADLDGIKAHVENGVLRITVPKQPEERNRQLKIIEIVEQDHKPSGGEDIKATKAEM